MLEKENITIYYFSGTGNTYKIARELAAQLKERGYQAELIPMAKTEAAHIELDGIIGLVFPVAIQSTYPLVWDFIRKMPKAEGSKVFMVDTMEAFSGGIVGPVKKVLERKGYNCIAAKEFKMSSSMMTKKQQSLKRAEVNEQALREVPVFVEALVQEKASWKRVPVLSDMMRSISKGDKIWKSQSKKITIDTDLCINCKICEKNCPTHSLRIFDGAYELDHQTCNSCMRCVNACPKNAFELNGKKVSQALNARVTQLDSQPLRSK